jgi:uncharacterized protein YbjT (DUF2867 family)
MILIVGASGKLGQEIARWALKEGKPVRAMSRKPGERLASLEAEGSEVVEGDLRDRASLERACAGANQVVASAHSVFGRGRERSVLVDDLGHKDLTEAAKKASVHQF